MSEYIVGGTNIRVVPECQEEPIKSLPVGNYMVASNMVWGLYLERTAAFTIPEKIYGDALKYASRIMQTFKNRSSSTGVLLEGEKGSGKTMLTKYLSLELAKEGVPTIMINTAFSGDAFKKFMSDIDTPSVVIFDEFEKIYEDRHDQAQILTLLDGVMGTKHLFLFTVNDRSGISEYMFDRPGRIFYTINYKGLDKSFIVDFCKDKLKNQDHVNDILRVSMMMKDMNFDMLQALVEEVNRYEVPVKEVIGILNIGKRGIEASDSFKLNVTDEKGEKVDIYRDVVYINPYASKIEVRWDNETYYKQRNALYDSICPEKEWTEEKEEEAEKACEDFDKKYNQIIENKHLVFFDPEGSFIFQRDGLRFELSRFYNPMTSWEDLL